DRFVDVILAFAVNIGQIRADDPPLAIDGMATNASHSREEVFPPFFGSVTGYGGGFATWTTQIGGRFLPIHHISDDVINLIVPQGATIINAPGRHSAAKGWV